MTITLTILIQEKNYKTVGESAMSNWQSLLINLSITSTPFKKNKRGLIKSSFVHVYNFTGRLPLTCSLSVIVNSKLNAEANFIIVDNFGISRPFSILNIVFCGTRAILDESRWVKFLSIPRGH